ncbi:MAG TPA: AMP-binding protein [Thermoplasmata archaeon]|nr:AMP-binding protein [Thermoplasmata archaeon]
MLAQDEEYHDLASLVRGKALKNGDRAALRFVGTEWSYAELDRRSDAVARGLAASGIASGERVATLLYNGPEFVATWFAAAKLGVTSVPLNTGLKGELLRYELADCAPKGLVVDARLIEPYLPYRTELAIPREWVVEGAGLGHPVGDGFVPFHDLLREGPALDPTPPAPSDPASILYTSGTTGPPKGALIPHEQMISTPVEIGRRSRLEGDSVLYSALPLFHCNAQEMTLLTALLNDLTAAFDERFRASTFWETAAALGATHVSLLIAMINVLYKQPEKPTDLTHRVRTALTAGATRAIWPKFEERFGLTVVELYGMTECGCTTLMNPPGAIRVGSVGTPLGFVEADVVDDQDRPVPVGERGELVVRPRRAYTMFLRYLNKPEATVDAWRNLWFHTGDYVRRDADGYYFFIDRKKDVIRRRGENIAPYDVESVLNAHPAVFESVVVGVPSEVGEEDVKAFVRFRDGADVPPRDLFLWCGERLPFFMVPRYLEVVGEIPKTANQKAQRFLLKGRRGEAEYDREKLGITLRRA